MKCELKPSDIYTGYKPKWSTFHYVQYSDSQLPELRRVESNWRVVRFGKVNPGEFYIPVDNELKVYSLSPSDTTPYIRFVVEKVPKAADLAPYMVRDQHYADLEEYCQSIEIVDYRIPNVGEYFLGIKGTVIRAVFIPDCPAPRYIIKKMFKPLPPQHQVIVDDVYKNPELQRVLNGLYPGYIPLAFRVPQIKEWYLSRSGSTTERKNRTY